jgi:hypothetical protein
MILREIPSFFIMAFKVVDAPGGYGYVLGLTDHHARRLSSC